MNRETDGTVGKVIAKSVFAMPWWWWVLGVVVQLGQVRWPAETWNNFLSDLALLVGISVLTEKAVRRFACQ